MARRDRFDGRGGPRDARRFTSDRDPLLPSDDGNGKSTHPSTSPDSYMAVFSAPTGTAARGGMNSSLFPASFYGDRSPAVLPTRAGFPPAPKKPEGMRAQTPPGFRLLP